MISVIICSIDDQKFQRVSANYRSLLADEAFEIIRINDARSLCEGYNRGIKRARGSILVFSHDDIEILTQNFAQRLREHLGQYDMIGVAGTTCLVDGNWTAGLYPHVHGQVAHQDKATGKYAVSVYGVKATVVENIQALDGLFFAATRRVVENISFDEGRFDGFHFYDIDFTFSAYLAGFKMAVCNDIVIAHESTGAASPEWGKYRQRFIEKHKNALIENQQKGSRIARFSTKAEVLEFCEAVRGSDYFAIW